MVDMRGSFPVYDTATMLHDQYEPFNRLARIQIHPPPNPNKPLTPFSITDILNGRVERRSGHLSHDVTRPGSAHGPIRVTPESRLFRSHPLMMRAPIAHNNNNNNNNHNHSPHPALPQFPPIVDVSRRFLRPWDDVISSGSPCSGSTSDDNDEEIDIEDEKPPRTKAGVSPLDALFQMASKTFDGRGPDGELADDGSKRDQLSLFSKSQPAKKRRKSRTAFTNQQIYELEKRFLYQKYLTPADRDEIAQSLGLTNAQVITWFQNRRAKLKRDLEELKADVTAAKGGSDDDSHSVVLPVDELESLKKNVLKRSDKKQPPVTTVVGSSKPETTTVSDTYRDGSEREAEQSPKSQENSQVTSFEKCLTSFGSPDSTTQPQEMSTYLRKDAATEGDDEMDDIDV